MMFRATCFHLIMLPGCLALTILTWTFPRQMTMVAIPNFPILRHEIPVPLWLAEVFRLDEIEPEFAPAMAYVSMTAPGVVRGPHQHREQADLFCFVGPSAVVPMHSALTRFRDEFVEHIRLGACPFEKVKAGHG